MRLNRTYGLWLAVAVLPAAIFACSAPERGNGRIVVRERKVTGFDQVEIRGNYELAFQKSDEEKIMVETDENLQDLIELSVGDRKLSIRNVEPLISRENIRITVYYNALKGISSTGSSVVSSDGMIASDEFKLSFEGAGSINLELEVEQLEVDMPGAGLVKLTGYANKQEIKIDGAGHLNAANLITNETKIELNGLGGADINVSKKLEARLNGVGSIRYKGNPETVDQRVNGMGVIKPFDEKSARDDSDRPKPEGFI